MKNPLSAKTRRALGILSGCPEGATVYALELVGVADAELIELVSRQLARMILTRPAKLKGAVIPRFFITDAGRDLAA